MKLFLFSVFISSFAFGQLPETDIWLVQLEKKENKLIYANPLNINNRVGYDNQPTFSPDGKSILYVSIKEDKQADIYQYTIKSKIHTALTKTQTSEYSPTIVPDGSGFSCVLVEMDSSQRVWQFKLDGSFNKIIAEQVDSVGYHTWLSKDTLLYYKLTDPHSLRAINIKTNDDVWLCNNPSRAFKKIGNTNNFIYAIKDSTSMTFRICNPTLRESNIYTTYPSINEDFIWHPELGLIKSENADLLKYNEQTRSWETLFSFAPLGIKKITRFVFDSKTKQLAIVSNL
jgi:dipeptidyl aminopeptidase/acylaminoacyl peptidase